MKHYSEQPPIKPKFDKEAALDPRQAIKHEVERMGKGTKREYDALLEGQQKAREIEMKLLKAKRANEIRKKVKELSDDSTRPSPRPKRWASISQRERQRAAKHDATALVLRDEASKMAKFEAACLQQQKELLSNAKLKEARQSAPCTVANDNSRSMSRDFNDKGGRSL